MPHASGRQGIVILGSTGSIGTSTLDVIASLPERFRVVGLAAGSNTSLLLRQIHQFEPAYVAIRDEAAFDSPAKRLTGPDRLTRLSTVDAADIVVIATTGHSAIEPTIAALQAGKIVALANKESIVAAGSLVMAAARERPDALRPIDSEHSAIWQCIGKLGSCPSDLRRLILTASGGPFRGKQHDDLRSVTPDDALRHPNWSMGPKVTIDSATLMNKGLELIEASWLFDVRPDDIDVVIHPQSIVHSLVEYNDGSLIAQLGPHDMRLPIQYALTWPDRVRGPSRRIDIAEQSRLEFARPDDITFPAVSIARNAARLGLTYPTVLSSADEVVVGAFLAGHIAFLEMMPIVERVLEAHRPTITNLTIDAVREADQWAREWASAEVRGIA